MRWADHGSSLQKVKGRAGVEPATYRAATNCSTTELTPQRRHVRHQKPPRTTYTEYTLQQEPTSDLYGSPSTFQDDDTTKKCGGAGYRSLCLLHAKQALYHLSYTPKVTRTTVHLEIRLYYIGE